MGIGRVVKDAWVTGKTAHSASLAGLLVVDKPLGWSSMEVVRRVRHAAGGVKTGHAGTLDPLATGVVVCCLGPATRLVEQLMGLPKIYEARIDLSAFTTTDDREGPRTEVAVPVPPDEAALRVVLATFVGQVQQTPPNFSAVHVAGQRAYKLARRGQEVELAARTVRIDAVELLSYVWPVAQVRVHCGRGTYIRAIARDLGVKLGTGGHLAGLRRTAVGRFDLSRAVTAERLRQPLTQADLLPGEV
jgi:tRNA pseudouridine55 synthase